MTLAHWLLRTAQAHPDLPAVALGPRPARTYEALAQTAAALAGWLRRSGARRIKPIAIVSENRVEVIETLFACWWAGFPVAPIAPDLAPEDLARALAYSEAEACFASPRCAGAVAAAAGPGLTHIVEYEAVSYRRATTAEPFGAPLAGSNRDTAWLAFSDREPGQPPRAAMLSHEALMSLALSLLAELETVRPRDAQIHALPWTGPSGFTMLPTLARGGLNVMPETGAFDAAELFENAARWRRASTMLSESHLRALLSSEAPMDEGSFRTIAVKGVGVCRALIERGLDRFGARLARLYGQCAFPIGLTRLNAHDVSARGENFWQERVRSVGRPFLTTEISVRAEDGRRVLEPGETGWIYARGQHGMRGYWRDRRSRAGQGGAVWRRLEILGAVDRHGYLSMLGAPEHLLPGPDGARLAPEAVESFLKEQPGVRDAAATIRPTTSEGGGSRAEEIVVFVERDRNAESCGLLDPTDGSPLPVAARYEIDALPRNANGRLQRAMLRRWALERVEAGGAARPDGARMPPVSPNHPTAPAAPAKKGRIAAKAPQRKEKARRRAKRDGAA